MNDDSLKSLLDCLKVLSKKHDAKDWYPSLPYYTVIRWIKLLRRGAIFELDKRGDICWNLPETEE